MHESEALSRLRDLGRFPQTYSALAQAFSNLADQIHQQQESRDRENALTHLAIAYEATANVVRGPVPAKSQRPQPMARPAPQAQPHPRAPSQAPPTRPQPQPPKR